MRESLRSRGFERQMGVLFKRIIDIIVALFGLIFLSPVFFIFALVIAVTEGFPIFYVSSRYISPTKKIKVYKFRSMVSDATNEEKYRLEENYMKDGFLDIPITAQVYTRIGRILERTQVVEAPQLINVLFGQMSLIGNRPLPKKNVDKLRKHPFWRSRFASPSGMTGITQIVGRLNLTAAQRLKLERMYSSCYHNGNILLCDLFIFFNTLKLLLSGGFISYDKAVSAMKKYGSKV